VKDTLNYKIINVKNNPNIIDYDYSIDYLIITQKQMPDLPNQLILDNFPYKIEKILELINVNFFKKKFKRQSDIQVGGFKINMNSRVLFDKNKELSLTEKEAKIILFLKNSKLPVNISILQENVWGYKNKLETHTVETHIYRLRKKIKETFDNDSFISSVKSGYIIK
jgi:DNA-binding response OmpR family regulator